MSRSLVGSSSSSTFGSAEQQPQELQPPPLAARQVVQPGGQPLAGEAEVLQQRAGAGLPTGGQPGLPADPLDRLQHALGPAELGHGLAEVADLQRPAALDRAGVRRLLAQQQPQQRGLAGAVHPDDPDPLARPDGPGQVAEQYPRRVRWAPSQRPPGAGRRRPCPAVGWPAAAAPAGPAAAARRRSACWPRRSGTSACWSAPAVRGAARPAPCAAGSSAGPAIPAACRARSARASTYAA